MPLEPENWNVTVVGRWNRAIYTPQGIASRLFKLPENTETEIAVEVPFDATGPLRVNISDLFVMVDSRRLVVQPETPTFEDLQRALEIAKTAMLDLPHTPFTAAGWNIRYSADLPCDDLGAIQKMLSHEWDSRIATRYKIDRRNISRRFLWRDGKVLVVASLDTAKLRIELNFERAGTKNESEEMVKWLSIPVSQTKEQVDWIFENVFLMEKTENQ